MKESPPVIVVGNKCDLEGAQRVVTKEEGQALAAELGQNEGLISFAETSAKTDINVYEVFSDVIRRRKVQREAIVENEQKKKKQWGLPSQAKKLFGRLGIKTKQSDPTSPPASAPGPPPPPPATVSGKFHFLINLTYLISRPDNPFLFKSASRYYLQ